MARSTGPLPRRACAKWGDSSGVSEETNVSTEKMRRVLRAKRRAMAPAPRRPPSSWTDQVKMTFESSSSGSMALTARRRAVLPARSSRARATKRWRPRRSASLYMVTAMPSRTPRAARASAFMPNQARSLMTFLLSATSRVRKTPGIGGGAEAVRDSAFQRGLVSSPVPVRALGAPGGSKCRSAVWPSQAVATAPPLRVRATTPLGAMDPTS